MKDQNTITTQKDCDCCEYGNVNFNVLGGELLHLISFSYQRHIYILKFILSKKISYLTLFQNQIKYVFLCMN